MPEEEFDFEEARARSFWSGTLTFGLVSIPVALFPANRTQRVSLRMLAPDGTPLRREYFDPSNNRKVVDDDLVRGYELDDGEYVVMTEEELESVEPDKSRDIDLRLFVPRAQLDPLYFDRAYYLTPGGESNKAYRLLVETMQRTGRAGIATFVMRAKEYLIAILAEDGIMRAETLRFADELRTPEDIGLPEPVRTKSAQVKQMEAAVKKLEAKKFDPDELVDRARLRLLELVEQKRANGEDVIESDIRDEPRDGIIDLMEVLKRSLTRGDRTAGETRRPLRKSAARKAATKKPAAKQPAAKKAIAKKSAAKKSAPGKSGARKKKAS